MRHCLQPKPVNITSWLWKPPIFITPTQQRPLRGSKRALLKAISTTAHVTPKDEPQGKFVRAAATIRHVKGPSYTAGDPEGPQLPLSPLLDPDLIGARNRHKVPKSEPSSEPSAFQKKLQKDPYAQALATPVRQCAVTGARLPNFFLLDFGLTPHPRTGKPWQMPRLVADTCAANPGVVLTVGSADGNATAPSDPATAPTKPAKTPARTSAGSHIVAHRSAVKLVSTLKQRSYMQLLPQRWKLDARFKADQIVWRQDMDTFVLDLLRRKVAKLLKYLSSQPAAYIVPCKDYECIRKKHQPGAVLWLGPQHPGDDKPIPSHEDPPPYAMVESKSSELIPLYNLPTLLGPEVMHELQDKGNAFEGTLAVIKRKRNTTDCQMQLWKLMGYTAADPNAA
ncbi:MAG: hypothetical protein Q9168_002619 [Polycauliona sp. 1 TL-2023]